MALCILISLAGADVVLAQVEGYRLLFNPDSTTISEDDQRAIFDQLGYTVSADGTSLEVMDCGAIYTQVDEDDLNGDGIAEVFVLGGNACTSGMAGSSLALFIKNAEGSWVTNLGFPAGGWTKLETSNLRGRVSVGRLGLPAPGQPRNRAGRLRRNRLGSSQENS